MGCFWGAEKEFWSVPGVWVTAVGYQGGTTPNPTYQESCTGKTGHAEAVRVVYDPSAVLRAAAEAFWESHDPTQGLRQGNDVGTQYRSAIFTHSPAQLAAATASRDMYQPSWRSRAMARSRPRSARPRRSTSPRTTTSSTWRRTRTATARTIGPAWPCPTTSPSRRCTTSAEAAARRREADRSSDGPASTMPGGGPDVADPIADIIGDYRAFAAQQRDRLPRVASTSRRTR